MPSRFFKLFTSKSAKEPEQAVSGTPFDQALALQQQGKLKSAQALCLEIIAAQPDHVEAHNLVGVLCGQLNDFKQAVRYFDHAIAVQPHAAATYCNRGLALKELREWDAALASFDRAIALNGSDPVAHYARGNIFMELGRPESAVASYDKAIEIKPDLVQAHGNRAFALHDLRRFEAAVAGYDRAIALSPNDAASYLLRGNALKELNRLEDALASYDKALDMKPDYAEALTNRGVVLYDLARIDDALDSYDRAIAAKPEYADAYVNRAAVRRMVKRFGEAADDYRVATTLAPNIKFLPGAYLETRMQICDWQDMEASLARLTAGIERDEPQAHPFAFLTFWDSPRLQRKAAEIWVAETCPPDASLGAIAPRPPHGKIRVGYFSGDFRDHPTARLLSELIETHDRNRFEVIAFSFGPNTQDDSRKRLERAFDRFLDVRAESNVDIAALARTLNVDIAVDLCGYIHGSRPQIFALRAAPLQVSYLGFPGTMGARYMDYLVADATVITPGSEQHYVEKIIYLPNSYQVNDTQRLIADGTPSREALDLPAEGFVYCCFNNNYKIVPATFAGWMRILSQVPGSVLWLLEDNAAAADSLRHSALQAGVRPERLVFGKRISPEDHLARHRRADLFLDTLPYNAHTTASDALWVNLPVLTLAGESFAARVAASLLKAVDLPELIAPTQAEYEAMAIELGSNPERLADIKKKLAAHRLAKPLFDSRLFARHLETAFSVIHERHRAGLAPDHLHVPSG